MRQTTIVKKENVKKEWYIADANGKTLGKLATVVASILRGKNKNNFTPNINMGNNVIVINAEKIVLTANKEEKKLYYSHSGYPGGLKIKKASDLREKKPYALVEKAIKGMLPHTKLGRDQFRKLHVYVGPKHKHEAQKPKKLEIK
jgi:large subunit ribosomal protein L13